MKGLLLKDFLNLKGFGRILLVIVVLYAAVAVISGDISFITSLLMVFCAMLPMTSIALDDQANWGAYAQCLPVSRRQVVLSKYLMVLITVLAAFAFSLVMALLASIRGTVDWGGLLASFLSMACAIVLMAGVSMPAIYKFGVEKARLIIMIVFMLGIMPFIMTSGGVGLLDSIPDFVYAILPVVVCAVYAGSYFLSLRIYSQKEF